MEDYGYRNQVVEQHPEPVSMKDWMVTLLIMLIPLVNIVMPFVWAFGGGTNPSKANFFKAQLLLVAIGIVIWFLFAGTLVTSFMRNY